MFLFVRCKYRNKNKLNFYNKSTVLLVEVLRKNPLHNHFHIHLYPMTTEERLTEYLEYFATAKFPPVPIQINAYMSVTGVDSFIQGQVNSIRNARNTDAGRERTSSIWKS